jgi:bifunctional non-homologous end joining protein LigD
MPRKWGAREDALGDYHAKRSAGATPEPAGAVGSDARAKIFVVQKHAARQLHWDLRLELDGVLKSWAVPKGPSRNPADKRAAILVEDHPVEYADFEGVIPDGNYGAGAMIVWDRGAWVALEDPLAGLEKGKLLFELRGYKLRGVWTLVKMKKTERDWLLIKERDALVADPGDDWAQDSVLSGLTVEQLAAGEGPGAAIEAEAQRLGARQGAPGVAALEPMLAETAGAPFTSADWIFELKYDGYRFLAGRAGEVVRLQTRNGREATATFPDVARALGALPYDRFVADGEIVVHDDAGLPSFQRLQRRAGLSRAIDVRNAAVELPASMYLFDLLAFGDHDLRALPLLERKRLLRMLLPSAGPLRYSDHIAEHGVAFHEQVARLGLEGIVAKKAESRYRGGRSSDWLKIHVRRESDFVVVGFTQPKGARGGFGALQLAAYDGDRLVYCGTVGSGFTQKQLDDTHALLARAVRPTPPCEDAPLAETSTWVEPALVALVRFRELTDERLLRHPVFVRFRDDKKLRECGLPNAVGPALDGDAEYEPPVPTQATPELEARKVRFTNLKKVFWPEDGYTKGDLVDYYRAVSPWLLPYLRDRPVVLTRFPDGIHGKSFFQKDAPGYTPGWLRTERVWSEASERELSYFVCDDEPGLLYLANAGTIPLHIWSSRVGRLEQPDWCILDLDPKGAPFEHVVEVGQALRALCDDIGLPSFAKTSGSSGLHVLVPLGRQFTHDQARVLGELLARVVVDQLPAIATTERVIDQREGRVYVDYLQNGHGKLLVAPFSVRPIPRAPVSMTLSWDEVVPSLRSDAFTIADALPRLRTHGDPLQGVLTTRPDLLAALQRLASRV